MAIRNLRFLGVCLGVAAVTLMLLEAVLRAVPTLIPSGALLIFNADVRTRIAARRGLMSAMNVEFVPRDDNGPPYRLWHFRRNATIGGNLMDAMGFCNVPVDKYERDTAFTVITIGDSFTYCWRVPPDSAWPTRLSTMLGVSVYNLGVPDMGPYEEVQMLKRFGLQKHPQVVILAFYEGNDLEDAVKSQAYQSSVQVGPTPDSVGRARASLPRRTFYALMNSPPARWSYAFNLGLAGLGLLVQQLTEKRAQNNENFRYRLVVSGRAVAMNSANGHSVDLEMARALEEGRVHLEAFSDALRAYLRLAATSGFVPIVAYMPSAHNVYRTYVVFDSPETGRVMDQMHAAQLNFWQRMADSLHFRLIDLTGPLQGAVGAHRAAELLYRPNDLHLTALGHKVVAEYLATVLRSEFMQRRGAPGSLGREDRSKLQ